MHVRTKPARARTFREDIAVAMSSQKVPYNTFRGVTLKTSCLYRHKIDIAYMYVLVYGGVSCGGVVRSKKKGLWGPRR